MHKYIKKFFFLNMYKYILYKEVPVCIVARKFFTRVNIKENLTQ